MERTIASLEEQLTIANDENQQAVLRSESLVQELEDLSDKLGFTNSEVESLQETISSLVSCSDFFLYIIFLFKKSDFIVISEGKFGRSRYT